MGDTIPQVAWTFNQVVTCHYLLNAFKASGAIILNTYAGLLLIFLELLALEITKSNDVQM